MRKTRHGTEAFRSDAAKAPGSNGLQRGKVPSSVDNVVLRQANHLILAADIADGDLVLFPSGLD